MMSFDPRTRPYTWPGADRRPVLRGSPGSADDGSGVVPLPLRWRETLRHLDMVFQIVAGIPTARRVGVEALLRGVERLGYGSILQLLDAAESDAALPEVEAAIHHKALRLFRTLPGAADLKLILNLDGRTLGYGGRYGGFLAQALTHEGVEASALVLDLPERDPDIATPTALAALEGLKRTGVRLSLDDFGTGWGGLTLLHRLQADLVKLDRSFLADLGRDERKRALVRHLVNAAHVLGLQVVAEGVETEAEYMAAKDLGCDLAQGFLIHRPAAAEEVEAWAGSGLASLNRRDRRGGRTDQKLVLAEVDHIAPIGIDASLGTVFERFRVESTTTFLPVINQAGEPLGIVRERDLKTYAYSPYGKDLLSNKIYCRGISDFLWRCPVADATTRAEKILEIFSADEDSEGILIAENGRYAGFLSARSLLRILNEKNLALARDQNPLTKLPGNTMINQYLADAMVDRHAAYVFAYLDFDNFKPFNDKYGFRQGDRAITLFADILNKALPHDGCFIGHIGGDDFFAAFAATPFEQAEGMIAHVIARFRAEVESFYDEEARAHGYIMARDRQGVERRMPLLSASAALVCLPREHAAGSIDEISAVIATMKKEAKASPSGLAAVSIITPEAGLSSMPAAAAEAVAGTLPDDPQAARRPAAPAA